MKNILTSILVFLAVPFSLSAQTIASYSTAQAHSHNDYEQANPFLEAYQQKFGSIEADLFLVDDSLYTAHNRVDIKKDRTFSKLYLQPILSQIKRNNGRIYPEESRSLQLLIDFKTPAVETLNALVAQLKPYENILAPKGNVKIVISGNTPSPETYNLYPDFIYFDGRPDVAYTSDQLKRIGLISQAFQKYSKWNGEGDLPEKDKKSLSKVIEQTHQKGKKFRFWATPDNINSWKTMMSLQVDFLNTDKVIQMGDYLRTAPR